MMKSIVPMVGLKGSFKVKSPWKIDNTVIYECVNISTIAVARIEFHLNVLEEIYKKNGLTEDDYQIAVARDTKLVTLTSVGEPTLLIPDTHIDGLPDQGYVPYQQMILSIDLGLLPKGLDVNSIRSEIDVLIKKKLNLITKTKAHVVDRDIFVSWDQHQSVESSRKSGITPYFTDWERARDLEVENDALSDAVRQLESELIKLIET